LDRFKRCVDLSKVGAVALGLDLAGQRSDRIDASS
jgi:hypothetical protein